MNDAAHCVHCFSMALTNSIRLALHAGIWIGPIEQDEIRDPTVISLQFLQLGEWGAKRAPAPSYDIILPARSANIIEKIKYFHRCLM